MYNLDIDDENNYLKAFNCNIESAFSKYTLIIEEFINSSKKMQTSIYYKYILIKGIENIPNTSFVIASNHQSPWESFFLQTLFIPTSSIMKKEILMIPFFGWAIARLKPISINRKMKIESLRKAIEVGGARIREGYSILIFPEGTRKGPDDGIGKFGNSCGLLASNEAVPIVPICHNSGKYWLNKSFKKKPGEINIVIGRPIYGNDPKELTEKAHQWIKENYSKIN